MKNLIHRIALAAACASMIVALHPRTNLAAPVSVAGDYVCKSAKGQPCGTQVSLRLVANGYWQWAKYSGQYSVANGRVQFVNGNGGPVGWGSANIGPGTLTFNDFGDDVVWQKPAASGDGSTPGAQLASGTYFCFSAPGGCQTSRGIQILNGNYVWGSVRGTYVIVGGQVQFRGTTWGPAGWGPADIGRGSLIFRSSDGSSSEWRMASGAGPGTSTNQPPAQPRPAPQPVGTGPSSHQPAPCNPNVPSYAQPGCTSGGVTNPPPSSGNSKKSAKAPRCNPNVPLYAQPGCTS